MSIGSRLSQLPQDLSSIQLASPPQNTPILLKVRIRVKPFAQCLKMAFLFSSAALEGRKMGNEGNLEGGHRWRLR